MSDFKKELLEKKLVKPTEPARDFSSPKLAGFVSDAQIRDYQEGVLDLNIECWYETLRECTFETVFCPIEFADAKLFVDVYEKAFRDEKKLEVGTNLSEILDAEQLAHIHTLQNRLNNHFLKFNIDGLFWQNI